MDFRTIIPISKNRHPINYKSQIVAIGSCFAENMSQKFDFFKFKNQVNPFGIIFNAVSIEQIVNRIVNLNYFTENDIFFHNKLWQSFEIHSKFSHPNKEAFLENINKILKITHQYFLQTTHFVITYGTSWVYHSKNNGQIVANCHKVVQNNFDKILLDTKATSVAIQKTINNILSINPKAQFVFTVSPIRHSKDGFHANNISKSVLLQSIFETLKIQDGNNSNYFPSYEILLDELRDYRFYAPDMLHPNQIAIDYIWQRFQETNICENEHIVLKKVEQIQKMVQHRPIQVNAELNLKWNNDIQTKIQQIQKTNPEIIF